MNPVGPRSVYDEAKRFSEAATMAYNRYHGVNTHLVRIFNTYGPRLQANDGRVISNFMMQALRGEDLTIFGDGSQTRSFCYVSDLIAGILLLAKPDEHLPVNIGNDREFTMRECAEMVLAVTGQPKKLRSWRSRCRRSHRRSRCSASPIWPRHASCWAGSRRSASAKGWRSRSSTSAPAWRKRSGARAQKI